MMALGDTPSSTSLPPPSLAPLGVEHDHRRHDARLLRLADDLGRALERGVVCGRRRLGGAPAERARAAAARTSQETDAVHVTRASVAGQQRGRAAGRRVVALLVARIDVGRRRRADRGAVALRAAASVRDGWARGWTSR